MKMLEGSKTWKVHVVKEEEEENLWSYGQRKKFLT